MKPKVFACISGATPSTCRIETNEWHVWGCVHSPSNGPNACPLNNVAVAQCECRNENHPFARCTNTTSNHRFCGACQAAGDCAAASKELQPSGDRSARTEPEWRVGRKVGRTIYRNDILAGMMDSPQLAALVVEALNDKEFVEGSLNGALISIATVEKERDAVRDDIEHMRQNAGSNSCADYAIRNRELEVKVRDLEARLARYELAEAGHA